MEALGLKYKAGYTIWLQLHNLNVTTNAMFEIKFMTGFSYILWKDWWINTYVLVTQALLLKARTT